MIFRIREFNHGFPQPPNPHERHHNLANRLPRRPPIPHRSPSPRPKRKRSPDKKYLHRLKLHRHVPVPHSSSLPLFLTKTTRNFRSCLYPTPLPYTPGIEAEGHIISSPTPDLLPGDKVVWIGSGAYAEYSTCSISKIFRLPKSDTIGEGVAAASIAQGITALSFIERAYAVRKGEWILVQGASGGVGLWLCQLLSKLIGARVIGTAGSEEKMELARKNGAEVVVNYKTDNVVKKVMEVTGGEGVRAVFDNAGKATFEVGLQVLGRDGSMVVVGNASGNVEPFDIGKLAGKNLRVMKPSVFGYIGTREEFGFYAGRLFDFIAKNGVEEIPRKVFLLEEVRKAHVELEERKSAGKLLLKV